MSLSSINLFIRQLYTEGLGVAQNYKTVAKCLDLLLNRVMLMPNTFKLDVFDEGRGVPEL